MGRCRAKARKRDGRVVVGSGLALALILGMLFAASSQAAVDNTRGTVNIVVANAARASGPICLSVRDLTMNMVVGLICDGDDLDLSPRSGRITLDLPRRTFAMTATAPGATVSRISPGTFELRQAQTVLVHLAPKPKRSP